MPTRPVEIATDHQADRGDEAPIRIVFDWFEDATKQRLLFLDLGPASAAACRYLSAELGRLQQRQAAAQESRVDVAIDGYRAAHRKWTDAIPHADASITAIDPQGNVGTIEYRLPSGEPLPPTTDDECARFGFAKPDWSSLRQPILPPTDKKWRAAYDACSAARQALTHAADQLAEAIDGTDNTSRHLRSSALQLAKMLRNVPPIWPTKREIEFAFAIDNTRIVEYRQAVNEARRRPEAAEAAATEERSENPAVDVHSSARQNRRPSQAAQDPLMAEIETARREHKRLRMKNECRTVPQMFSLWQETTDLLFRTNLGDDARVEELAYLRTITNSFKAEAYKRHLARQALQKLGALLNTLMPREWFHDALLREQVREAVQAASVEVDETHLAGRGQLSDVPARPTTVADAAGDDPGPNADVKPDLAPQRNREKRASDFSGTSEGAVTAIVRALADLREKAPDIMPKKEHIKEKAVKTGGAGDRALARAIELDLITVDHLVTALGRQFLADRS